MHKSIDDERFLSDLYHQNYDLVCRVISHRLYRYGCSQADAPDLTQEVFFFAAKRISTLYTHANPKGWLCKTAHYMAMNHIHAQAQHKEILSDSIEQPENDNAIPALDTRLSLENLLSEEDYALLMAYCIERRPHAEICREYGYTESRLRVRIHRLRKFLLSNLILFVTMILRQYI